MQSSPKKGNKKKKLTAYYELELIHRHHVGMQTILLTKIKQNVSPSWCLCNLSNSFKHSFPVLPPV